MNPYIIFTFHFNIISYSRQHLWKVFYFRQYDIRFFLTFNTSLSAEKFQTAVFRRLPRPTTDMRQSYFAGPAEFCSKETESRNGKTPKRGKGWGVKHLVCMRTDTESKTLWNWLPIQFSGGRKDPFSSSSLPLFGSNFSLCCTSFTLALLYIHTVKSYIFLLMKVQTFRR
jgi:hypothetical protein